jgi:hypothetical protein
MPKRHIEGRSQGVILSVVVILSEAKDLSISELERSFGFCLRMTGGKSRPFY